MTKRTDGPSAEVRIRVYKRDRFMCTYCGAPGTEAELEVDHIIAVANGGSHHISNLTTACRKCNQKKGKKAMKPMKPRASSDGFERRDEHPLSGMFLHTMKDGKIRLQGHIIAVDGDICLVQLYSWMFGEPTNIEKMRKEYIYSDEVVLYANQEDWRHAAEIAQKRDWVKAS